MVGLVVVVALAGAPTAPAPAPSASAAPVTAEAVASKSEVTVGEPFTIEVKASGPPGTSYGFPSDASTEAFDLRPAPSTPGLKPTVPVDGSQRYQAAVYALGDVTIPPIPVRYLLPDGTRGETATAPLPLKVVTLLPKNPDERKLADIRGPVGVAIGRPFWIA